jgi:hypothetical protein
MTPFFKFFRVRALTAAAALLLMVTAPGAFAKEAVFNGDNYTIALDYNETAHPGDAVFVRMTITRAKKAGASGETSARLTLDADTSTDFYPVTPRSGKNAASVTMLAGLPFSTWQKTGQYTLTIRYTPFGSEPMTFTLPLTVVKKTFISETVPLDEANTGIRTDTSPKRTAQIEKLNNIFFARHKDAVFQQGAFKPPTTATRRTGFYGDRRVYAYSNGKSSTSVHFGIDYGVPTGTTVYSCAAGKVLMAEDRISTGWSVVIEHLPGLYSVYYHMDSLSVKEGDTVKMGAKIGASGATGLATGPHLHWEMRLGGVAVDPDFFTGDFSFFDKAN